MFIHDPDSSSSMTMNANVNDPAWRHVLVSIIALSIVGNLQSSENNVISRHELWNCWILMLRTVPYFEDQINILSLVEKDKISSYNA